MEFVYCSIDKKSPSSIFTTQPNISAFDNANGQQLAANKPQSRLANPVFITHRTWHFIDNIAVTAVVVVVVLLSTFINIYLMTFCLQGANLK